MRRVRHLTVLLMCMLFSLFLFGCSAKTGDGENDKPNSEETGDGDIGDSGEEEVLPYVECSGAKATVLSDVSKLRDGGDMQVIHYTQEDGDRTGIKFRYSDELEWGTLSDPEFYVYNPTANDYKLELFCSMDASAHTFQDMKSLGVHTATAGEWTKILVTAEEIADASANGTYPFLGISVKDEDNGGSHSSQWKAMELYFDGFGFLLSDPETAYDFIHSEIISIGGAVVEVSKNADYSKDITGESLKYTKAGTTTAFKFAGSSDIDWSSPELFTFWVYNPTKYDYVFSLSLAEDEEKVFTGSSALESPFEAAANGWTRVEVYGETMKRVAGEGYSTLKVYIEHPTNGGNGSEQWDAIELYFSGFSFICQ